MKKLLTTIFLLTLTTSPLFSDQIDSFNRSIKLTKEIISINDSLSLHLKKNTPLFFQTSNYQSRNKKVKPTPALHSYQVLKSTKNGFVHQNFKHDKLVIQDYFIYEGLDSNPVDSKNNYTLEYTLSNYTIPETEDVNNFSYFISPAWQTSTEKSSGSLTLPQEVLNTHFLIDLFLMKDNKRLKNPEYKSLKVIVDRDKLIFPTIKLPKHTSYIFTLRWPSKSAISKCKMQGNDFIYSLKLNACKQATASK